MIDWIHCMLKPDGLLFVGLPTIKAKNGYIVFNKERVYGTNMLRLLFNGWNIMGGKRALDAKHTLYILKKV